jgi:outer membrane protein insertion porin family
MEKILKRFGRKINWIFWIAVAVILASCTGTSKIPENEKLYTGARVRIKTEDRIPHKGELLTTLNETVRPKPNFSLFGWRPKLWIYQHVSEPKKKKGLKHFLKYKIGEPPVYLTNVDIEKNQNLLLNRIYNKGFFQGEIMYDVNEAKKTARISYLAILKEPYTVRDIILPPADSSILAKHVNEAMMKTLLKKGEPYDLELLEEERIRLDAEMKQKGYFYFNPDYFLYQIDSTIGNRDINIYLKIKGETPEDAKEVYHINKVYVYPQYSLTQETDRFQGDTIKVRDFFYIAEGQPFKPRVLARAIYTKRDSVYQRRNHDLTLSRLMGMNTFKFVSMRFEKDEQDSTRLNTHIYLTPMKKRTIQAEAQMVTKSNNFAGPAFKATYKNRNIFRGAELFILGFNLGLETQVSGAKNSTPLNSYSFELSPEFYIPKFVIPGIEIKSRSFFVPRTKIKASYQILNRVQFFNLNSFSASYGYTWRATPGRSHELNPVAINYVKLNKTTPLFDSLLDVKPFLERSFRQQFIVGSNYSYTYNNQVNGEKRTNFYFNGNIDLAGNSMYLVESLAGKQKTPEGETNPLFGAPYAQYSKLDFDMRYYLRLANKQRLATRLIAGVGVPYGNSKTLPYVKQFFIGGANSVRAFQARSLGPGSYEPADTSSTYFIDQTGDIKLETNLEWRYDITKMFKGALFVDAGNIWLTKKDPQRPGGEFVLGDFLSQMAVGAGAGLRIDASFFILRFDLAFPIRTPDKPKGEQWMSENFQPAKRDWRRENLILNIGIGYPF